MQNAFVKGRESTSVRFLAAHIFSQVIVMKKKFPVPLDLDCNGLSTKLILELADELREFFEVVDVNGDEISADDLISDDFRGEVESLIKFYAVEVVDDL